MQWTVVAIAMGGWGQGSANGVSMRRPKVFEGGMPPSPSAPPPAAISP